MRVREAIRRPGFQSRGRPRGRWMLCGWGLRWQAHWSGDARALYEMPEPAGSLTPGEQFGPTREKLESQAWTPAGAANALRLVLWRATHGEPYENAFHPLPQAAVGLKAEKCAPGARGDAGRCRVRADSQYRNGGIYVKAPSLFLKKRTFQRAWGGNLIGRGWGCGEQLAASFRQITAFAKWELLKYSTQCQRMAKLYDRVRPRCSRNPGSMEVGSTTSR